MRPEMCDSFDRLQALSTVCDDPTPPGFDPCDSFDRLQALSTGTKASESTFRQV